MEGPFLALKSARVWYGDRELVPLGIQQDLFVTIARGRYNDLDASLEIDSEIHAPLAEGQELGQVNIKLDGETLASQPLVAMQVVNDGGIVQILMDKIKLLFQ